jgi:hypothetical protein
MKRQLKPHERVALFAALVAIAGGLTPLLARGSDNPDGPLVFGLVPADFLAGFLLGLMGVLLVAGVAWWLKGRAVD